MQRGRFYVRGGALPTSGLERLSFPGAVLRSGRRLCPPGSGSWFRQTGTPAATLMVATSPYLRIGSLLLHHALGDDIVFGELADLTVQLDLVADDLAFVFHGNVHVLNF